MNRAEIHNLMGKNENAIKDMNVCKKSQALNLRDIGMIFLEQGRFERAINYLAFAEKITAQLGAEKTLVKIY